MEYLSLDFMDFINSGAVPITMSFFDEETPERGILIHFKDGYAARVPYGKDEVFLSGLTKKAALMKNLGRKKELLASIRILRNYLDIREMKT